jgi:hypothetical protein
LPFKPTRDPFSVLLAQTLSDLAVQSSLLHLQMLQGDRGPWLAVDPLRRETAVVDACLDVRLAQRIIRKRCPALPQTYVLLAVIGQSAAPAFTLIHVDPSLRAQPGRRYLASRRQQMRVEVAWITTRWRLVNCKIHGHFVAVSDLTCKSAREGHAADGVKLRGQGNLVFARYARVVTFLSMFGRVPEALAIPRPGDRRSFEMRWQENFRMQHIAATRVIEQLARAFIPNALAGARGGRG